MPYGGGNFSFTVNSTYINDELLEEMSKPKRVELVIDKEELIKMNKYEIAQLLEKFEVISNAIDNCTYYLDDFKDLEDTEHVSIENYIIPRIDRINKEMADIEEDLIENGIF